MKPNPGGQLAAADVRGRDELINRLWEVLDRQSVVITGVRRIGKTSVIRKMQQETREGWLGVYRDLEKVDTPVEFAMQIATDVASDLTRLARAKSEGSKLLPFFKSFEAGKFKLHSADVSVWKPLLETAVEDLIVRQKRKLVFFWDEVPLMLRNFVLAEGGDQQAMQVLDTLRALRQQYGGDGLRMVFTGSIGLHHVFQELRGAGYGNRPTNDMHLLDMGPLEPTEGMRLARALLPHGTLQAQELTNLAAALSGAVDHHPFYIQQVADLLATSKSLATADITRVVEECLCHGQDPWDLRHFSQRLDQYYRGDAPLARAILDVLAHQQASLPLAALWEELQSHGPFTDREVVRRVLDLLRQDHYLELQTGAGYRFMFPLLARWWRVDRGL